MKKMPTNELFDIFIYVNILVLFCRSYHEYGNGSGIVSGKD